jgi:hypothetical protein
MKHSLWRLFILKILVFNYGSCYVIISFLGQVTTARAMYTFTRTGNYS